MNFKLSGRRTVQLPEMQKIENLLLLLNELQGMRSQVLVIIEASLDQQRLRPTQQFYCFEGDLIQYAGTAIKEGAKMNVTKISLGQGGTISGDVATAENIQSSFDKASSPNPPGKTHDLLQDLSGEVARHCKKLEASKAQAILRSTDNFIKEATAPRPNKDWLRITGKGLIEAAKTVAELAAPVTKAVSSVLKLFGITSF